MLLAAAIGTADHWMTSQFISDMAASPISPMTAIKAVASVSAWAMASGLRYLVDGLEGMPGMKGISVTPEEIKAAVRATKTMIESLGKKAPDDAKLRAMVLESLKGASKDRGAAIAQRLEKPPSAEEWYGHVGLRGGKKAAETKRKMVWLTRCEDKSK